MCRTRSQRSSSPAWKCSACSPRRKSARTGSPPGAAKAPLGLAGMGLGVAKLPGAAVAVQQARARGRGAAVQGRVAHLPAGAVQVVVAESVARAAAVRSHVAVRARAGSPRRWRTCPSAARTCPRAGRSSARPRSRTNWCRCPAWGRRRAGSGCMPACPGCSSCPGRRSPPLACRCCSQPRRTPASLRSRCQAAAVRDIRRCAAAGRTLSACRCSQSRSCRTPPEARTAFSRRRTPGSSCSSCRSSSLGWRSLTARGWKVSRMMQAQGSCRVPN